MSKTRSHMHMFFYKKTHRYFKVFIKKLIVTLNLHRPIVATELIAWISLFFGSVRFISTQLAVSPPFPLSDTTSPLVDITTPPRRVTLLSYRAKTNSLSPFYLLATFHPVFLVIFTYSSQRIQWSLPIVTLSSDTMRDRTHFFETAIYKR
jgi:hypothetical protein